MPRKEFEAFTRLDASDVNTFLMDQSVMSFAGTAARGSAITEPVEGMLTYLEDSDEYQSYNGTSYVTVADGSGWTTFVPVFGNLTVGNGTFDYAKYKVIGKTINIQVRFTLGSTSAVTGAITIEAPTEVERASSGVPGNSYSYFLDASTSTFFTGIPRGHPTILRRFTVSATGASGTYASSVGTTSAIPFTWTTSDQIVFSTTYEVD
jgi:hypothetical protein